MKRSQPICRTDHYGVKRYFLNDKLHREDGPALEYNDGTKYWFLNGKLHRADGPAVEWGSGHKEWWIKGRVFPSEQEMIKHKQLILLGE